MRYDFNSSVSGDIRDQLKSAFSSFKEHGVRETVVYNLQEYHRHTIGSPNKLFIFFNAAFLGNRDEVQKMKETPQLEGFVYDDYAYKTDLYKISHSGNPSINKLVSEDGFVIAEYRNLRDGNTLNITIPVEEEHIIQNLLPKIVAWVKELMSDVNRMYSWKRGNQEVLQQHIKEHLNRDKESRVRRLKEKMDELKQRVESRTRDLTQTIRNLEVTGADLLREENSESDMAHKVLSELVPLSNHPKIKDVMFIDQRFVVHTNPLIITDSNDNTYYGGEYVIKINMENSDITITNDQVRRRGHWTSQDPHPHVDGNDGTPCFGNVATSLSQLCASYELYAIVLLVIDFLEQANLSDVAGARVVNWDRCDKDGNIITGAPTPSVDDDDEEEHDEEEYDEDDYESEE